MASNRDPGMGKKISKAWGFMSERAIYCAILVFTFHTACNFYKNQKQRQGNKHTCIKFNILMYKYIKYFVRKPFYNACGGTFVSGKRKI